ncbi:hypothetical protein D7207_39100 [Burkholderia cepacia]|nr:hypothetical protein [Burkholderia cepacia]MBA9948960.1 hypothetical protein [Burkholderia cepacia]MBA9979247.1 hypothetical protein [Burkholderia cepacia]MBA9998010.1 hypothetical protein [Burkholderia cepacia]MBB0006122.1 hypothetical protein [Burkholderia cepacia]
MEIPKCTLHEEIVAVFERACREGAFDAAEFLLCALEATACPKRSAPELDHAYLVLANTIR